MEFCAMEEELTESVLHESLSNLAKTPEGRYAYLTMTLSSRGLCDISILTGGYSHIQFVDVSSNNLKSLEAMALMYSLRELKASE